jgi:hypothetical protein
MRRTTGIIRRATLTVAMAGAATFGAVALAPAASAAQPSYDGPSYIVDGPSEKGPVAFLVTDQGRSPIFYCEADKPKKRHNVCQEDPTTVGGDRL